jgi:hypothetical protein
MTAPPPQLAFLAAKFLLYLTVELAWPAASCCYPQ